ncbi:MAG: tetratricopeptide repeat protein [Ignavibacteria bacterium]|nr:tetratricopeptide repeat protein [Ignavibacteria bacterium]MBT8381288.1 tetratricopeptide repeat protein [Ignavibacteria bacterium]MBT8392634.1 tetratricopeptide repeat protein [Ignavibacteria bacterium]NNL20138.1 tetratricopeptide repeat protein [Ignavibacteriaceae bacterium]
MKRIHKIIDGWEDSKDAKSLLREKIDELFFSITKEGLDSVDKINEVKNIFLLVKSNHTLEQLVEFSLTITNQLLISRKLKEAEYVLNTILAEEINETIEAEIFLLLADVTIRECRWDECLRLLSEAKIIFEKHSDNFGRAKVENLWGIFQGERGEIDLAKDHFKIGLSLINLKENPDLAAQLESNLAITEIICYNFVSAEKYLKNGLNAFPDSEDNRWLAEMIHNYGTLHLHKKNYKQALEDFDGVIEIAEENNHLEILTISKGAKALTLLRLNRIDDGIELAEESLLLAQQTKDKLAIADINKVIGIGERLNGNYKNAEEYLQNSYNLNMQWNNNLNAADSAFELAVLFKETINIEKSKAWYKIASNYFESIGAKNRLKSLEEFINSV